MTEKFDSWIYCQKGECIRILESLHEDNLVNVPKEVVSGDMDLLIHIKGVVISESESLYTVRVECCDEIRDQLNKIRCI